MRARRVIELRVGKRTTSTPIAVGLFWLITLVVAEAAGALFLNVESADPATGLVVLNGAFDKPSVTGPGFNWGDGTNTQGFFPQTHVYADTSRNYLIRAIVFYDDGSNESQFTGAYFVSENYNLAGAHVSLTGFPPDYFLGATPAVSPAELVRLMDIQFELLNSAHTDYDGQRIIVSYGGNCGGAYSVATNHTVVMCDGFKVANIYEQNVPWTVFAHEMSHNQVGNSDTFLYSFIHLYSAYLDEHQAEVTPELVLQSMRSNGPGYGISPEIVAAMSRGFNVVDYTGLYNQYVANGRPFYISQDNVGAATLTGQATAQVMLNRYRITGDVTPLRSFVGYLRNGQMGPALAYQTPTVSELSNYVVAAWSAAFRTDLRADFRALNYPVSDALVAQYANAMIPGLIDLSGRPAPPRGFRLVR